MLVLAAVCTALGVAGIGGARELHWWIVLPVLWLAAVLSMRGITTTAGLHRGGRDVMVVPVGQYFFAAAILLPPWALVVLAVAVPTNRNAPRSIAVRCQRTVTMLSSSATFWGIFGSEHPRLNGDESWLLIGALTAAMVVHTLMESALVSLSVQTVARTSAKDTNIWNAYNAIRDLWELAIGGVGAVLALMHPAFTILMVPIVVLAVDHVRLERDNRQSRVDPRTELLNLRGFQELSRIELDRAAEGGHALALLVLDLDHLRDVNNTHGHRTGDAVITEVGHRILGGTRRDDVVARVGGEEFVALLPDASLDIAVLVAERVRVAICSTSIDTPSGPLAASVSVGVARWTAGESLDALFDRADAAMYKAKQAGRNWVCVAAEPGNTLSQE